MTMVRLAANISMLFTELPFIERFEAARSEGFEAVEFAYPAETSLYDILKALDRTGLRQVLGTLPAAVGDKGIAAVKGAEQEFRKRFLAGLESAVLATCPLMHITTGVVTEADLDVGGEVFERNMVWAIPHAELRGVKLVIEAINQIDLPDYFIRSLEDARAWVKRIASPSFGLLIDFYHAHIEGRRTADVVRLVSEEAFHVQIAGAPGRAEPDTGEVDFASVLGAIDRSGWAGWVGCEYRPATETRHGLAWRKRLLAAPA